MNVFDYVNAILTSKKHLFKEHADEPDILKLYLPWTVNEALSMHADTVLDANMMNMYASLPTAVQFEYYINSVRAKKRRHFWAKDKSKHDKDLEAVCQYYVCNRNVGKHYLSLMPNDVLENMKKELETGGIK